MHKYNTTDWFSSGLNPSRPGVYECSIIGPYWFRYFDGEFWYYGGYSPSVAFEEYTKYPMTIKQLAEWRGVTNDWIDAAIHPEFEGVYPVNTPYCPSNNYSKFEDNNWRVCCVSLNRAAKQCNISSHMDKQGSKYKLYKD